MLNAVKAQTGSIWQSWLSALRRCCPRVSAVARGRGRLGLPSLPSVCSSASSPLRTAFPHLPELTSRLPAAKKRGGVPRCPSSWLLCHPPEALSGPVPAVSPEGHPCAAPGTCQANWLAQQKLTQKLLFVVFSFPLTPGFLPAVSVDSAARAPG